MQALNVIKSVSLFRGASDQDLAALAAIAEPKAYMNGEYIYRSGDTPDALLIVESGTIDLILKDQDVAVATIGSGQAFGDGAFFDRQPRLASALTREATHIVRLPFDRLDGLFESHPGLALVFYRHSCAFMARQLRQLVPDLNHRYF